MRKLHTKLFLVIATCAISYNVSAMKRKKQPPKINPYTLLLGKDIDASKVFSTKNDQRTKVSRIRHTHIESFGPHGPSFEELMNSRNEAAALMIAKIMVKHYEMVQAASLKTKEKNNLLSLGVLEALDHQINLLDTNEQIFLRHMLKEESFQFSPYFDFATKVLLLYQSDKFKGKYNELRRETYSIVLDIGRNAFAKGVLDRFLVTFSGAKKGKEALVRYCLSFLLCHTQTKQGDMPGQSFEYPEEALSAIKITVNNTVQELVSEISASYEKVDEVDESRLSYQQTMEKEEDDDTEYLFRSQRRKRRRRKDEEDYKDKEKMQEEMLLSLQQTTQFEEHDGEFYGKEDFGEYGSEYDETEGEYEEESDGESEFEAESDEEQITSSRRRNRKKFEFNYNPDEK